MKRDELIWALQVAPAFATYAMKTSGAESLRHTATAMISSGGDEEVSAELLSYSSAGAHALTMSESDVRRLVGYGWSAVDAGNRHFGLASMLISLRLIMRGWFASLENRFVSFVNTSGTISLVPLMAVIMWGTGFGQLDPLLVALMAFLSSVLTLAMVYMNMFRDLPWYELYALTQGSKLEKALLSSATLGLLASAPAAYLIYTAGGPAAASLALAGLVMWAHLTASERIHWLRLDDLPGFLTGVAGAYKAGVPINTEIQRLAAQFPAARDLAYEVPRPSLMYTAALMLYKAIREAGPLDEALEYYRDVLGEVKKMNKTVSSTSLMLSLIFAGASVAVVVVTYGTVVQLADIVAQAGAALPIMPPNPAEFASAASQIVSLVAALQTAAAFLVRGLYRALVYGSAVGAAVWAAITFLT